MASRARFRMDTSRPILNIGIPNFQPIALIVENNTGSAIYIREGSQENPTAQNADHQVPAGAVAVINVIANEFALQFANLALLNPAAAYVSGLGNFAIIEVIGKGETIPALGTSSFLSLSLSQLIPATVFAGTTTPKVLDIGAWGGAMIWLAPTAASGQGVLQISVSEDGITFVPFDTRAFWPNIPFTVNVPRVARYMALVINSTTIAGEPGIAGTYGVRASLSEIPNTAYNPQSTSLSLAYNIANLSEANKIFVTVGLPAISIAVNETAGAGSAGELIVETSNLPTGPWLTVTFREQNVGFPSTLYRTFGTLGLFTRVRFLNTGIAGPLIGSLTFSIAALPDTSYLLSDILRALGDVSAPTNVRQDIYHELETIYQLQNSRLPAIAISDASIDAKLTGIAASDVSIDSKLTNVAANTLSTANNILTSNTYLAQIYNGVIGAAVPFSYLYTTGGAGVPGWQNTANPPIPDGARIIAFQLSIVCGVALAAQLVGIGTGTNAGLFNVLWQNYINVAANVALQLPLIKVDSIKGAGFPIVITQNPLIYVYAPIASLFYTINVYYV